MNRENSHTQAELLAAQQPDQSEIPEDSQQISAKPVSSDSHSAEHPDELASGRGLSVQEDGPSLDSAKKAEIIKTASQHEVTNKPEAAQNESKQNNDPASESNEDYSIFSTGQKRAIVLTASFCAFFSPVTASIYYPALDTIAHDLNVTNTAINLTVTTYLVSCLRKCCGRIF